MLTVQQQQQQQPRMDDVDELDGLLSMSDLSELDMGRYTMKLLSGADRLYRLKIPHSTQLMQDMIQYRKEGRFCDVVLRVNDQRYPAHRVVLASASPYFASMFGRPGHLEALKADDIDLGKLIPCHVALDRILDFIYTSEVQLNDKRAMMLLAYSIPLLLDDLTELCVAFIHDRLHPSNCIGLYLFGKQLQCESLEAAAQQFVFDHFEEVVRHEEFLGLSYGDLCLMVKDDKVKVKCESIIYNAVMQWVRHDLPTRGSRLLEILHCVRLEYLDPSFLQGILHCNDLATSDMKRCRDYVSNLHGNLISHQYFTLLPRRDPIKPLVIYCAGGYNNKSINTVECYFTRSKEWKECAKLPGSRSGIGVVSLFMRVFVIGGRQNTKTESKDCADVERYDPFVNKWASLSPMRYARNRLGVGVIDYSIYAVGGSCGQHVYSSVERYAVKKEADGWTEVAPMHIARIGLAVCTHSRLLYAIGGFDGHRRLADVESYNPDTNVWTREAPLRISRSGAAASPFAESIYVVGGYASDTTAGATQLNAVEQFNTITQQWSIVKSMNSPRSALTCVTLENRLYAIGGYDGKQFSAVVEVYNPNEDEWTYGASLTHGRSGHGSALTVEPTLDTDD